MNTTKSLILISVLSITSLSAIYGQLNFGLSLPQESSTLPKSAVAVQQVNRKAKLHQNTVLKPVRDGEWILTNGWELAESDKIINSDKSLFDKNLNTTNWYNATVPGTVLTSLVNQGIYPDPYFGINNLAIPESLCRTDWWYRIPFNMPANPGNKIPWLIFNGINYKADIWLNGQKLGSINGAFMRGEFNISKIAKTNEQNILAVHILPPPNPGIPHEQSAVAGRGPNGGQLCLDGPTFISSEGWDWVPGIHDRNIGIWQDVKLCYTGDVRIIDPQVISQLPLPDTTHAGLTIKVGLANYSNQNKTITLSGKIGDISFNQQVEINGGEQKTVAFSPDQFAQLNLKNPKLWWPNGYGSPNLYTLALSANTDNQLSDSKVIKFGIRELSYEMTIDAPSKKGWRVEFNPVLAAKGNKPLFDNVNHREFCPGTWIPSLRNDVNNSLLITSEDTSMQPFLVIKVNGKRIFCKGGNWGMDDAMKNCSREYLEPYFRLHRDAHFNMVRNWTGESTEETFYELCDEYGLLVWNDFWLSTEGYNLNVNDSRLFLDNAREVIRRFRNHPSIAIWCPRNEGYAPAELEDSLAYLVVHEDGTRHYQPNSRYMNLRPSGPWHYFTDAADYFKNEAKGFDTELGTPSLPTSSTLRKFIAKEDLWPISDVWYYHDLHFGQKEYINAIDYLYGKSKNIDEFCKKAQLVNYDSHRAMFEAWNSRMWNNTSGLLLWMTHPAWPSVMWQVYSWDKETFGSYFGAQKACEPIHIQINEDNNNVVVSNTTLNKINNATAIIEFFDLNGNQISNQQKKVDVEANQLTNIMLLKKTQHVNNVYLIRAKLFNNKGEIISENEYWKTNCGNFQSFNSLPQVFVNGKIEKITKSNNKCSISFRLTNNSKILAISLELNAYNPEAQEIILPAYFSEGYFNLLPGESKIVKVEIDDNQSLSPEILITGYNIKESKIRLTK